MKNPLNVKIIYTKTLNELPVHIYEQYLNHLPIELQKKNLKYLKWQDRHSHLFGKLLLKEALLQYGYNNYNLDDLWYNEYNRPFLSKEFDFNISHSGAYTICAVGKNMTLGVDIQEIRDFDLEAFKRSMSPEQWRDILSSENSRKTFFTYWAIKESVIKADSRGLSIPLEGIRIEKNIAICDYKKWHLQELHIDDDYCAFLASSCLVNIQDVLFINYMNFFNN
jgi:4'-phosphopantetheinyl transferase